MWGRIGLSAASIVTMLTSLMTLTSSERRSAIAADKGIATRLWGGILTVEPRAKTGIHHHGEQETIAYVLEGDCLVRWGESGEYCASSHADDHIPAWLPHMEINPSEDYASPGLSCAAHRSRS